MGRRGCLRGVGVVLIGLLLCCAGGYLFGLPVLQDRLRDDMANAFSTEVSDQITGQLPAGQVVQAGEYRISVAAIQDRIEANLGESNIDQFSIRTEGQDIFLRVGTTGQSVEYRGTPGAENGRFVMNDMRGGGGFVDWFMSADALGSAVEMAVNRTMQNQGLQVTSAQIMGDDLILETQETTP